MDNSKNDILLREILEQLTMLRKANEELTKQLQKKDAEIERLNQILLNMQRARFGRTSEKSIYVLTDGCRQMSIFDTGETAEDVKVTESEPVEEKGTEVTAHTRKKRRTLEELCADLPAEEKVLDLDEADKYAKDGHPLTCIGKEYIRTEVVMERAKIRVIKHYRQVYADREYEQKTGNACIRKPEPVPPLIPHSYASASMVTDVLVKKYADALPLYRQEQM